MKPVTLHVIGASATDDIYEDEFLPGKPIWNITRLIVAARSGAFGPAKRFLMSVLPPMTPEAIANIDWQKVDAMIASHTAHPGTSPLNIPAIMIEVKTGRQLYRLFADGNHRTSARRKLGMGHFGSFVVPADMEHVYRVRFVES